MVLRIRFLLVLMIHTLGSGVHTVGQGPTPDRRDRKDGGTSSTRRPLYARMFEKIISTVKMSPTHRKPHLQEERVDFTFASVLWNSIKVPDRCPYRKSVTWVVEN